MVWYKEVEINNILSLIRIRKNYTIIYYTEGNLFVVVKTDRETLFGQSAAGLYFHGMFYRKVVLINTVKESREGFTQSQYKGTKQV